LIAAVLREVCADEEVAEISPAAIKSTRLIVRTAFVINLLGAQTKKMSVRIPA
jgi:hypothetical protein